MVAVGEDVAVTVDVDVAVLLGVLVEVCEGVTVLVAVAVDVAVAVNVWVAVSDIVPVAVGVTVAVAVEVAVEVTVNVEVATGPLWVTTTSCGAAVPSRDEKVTPSLPSATSANVYVPLPLTRAVTSYSTHVLVAMAPLLSNALLNNAGWLFHVIPPVPDSIQLLSAR